MTSPLPDEVSDPIVAFVKKYKWVIILIGSCVIVGYASVLLLGKNNPIEIEVEKVIEAETGVKVDLTP